MGFKIIDNKKVEMTEDEYIVYTSIVKSYTINNNKGEDLFADSFVVDDDGLITSIPPSKKASSLECIIFIMSLQQNQQLRKMRSLLDDEIKQIKQKLSEIK